MSFKAGSHQKPPSVHGCVSVLMSPKGRNRHFTWAALPASLVLSHTVGGTEVTYEWPSRVGLCRICDTHARGEMMNIEEIIVANRAVLNRMRNLNVRAGSDVFLIPSREELRDWFADNLQGARNLAAITDEEALRLPEPDPSMVATILAECPDKIRVLDRMVDVHYREPYYGSHRAPQVVLNFHYMAADDWKRLPESGIHLPDGREVTISGSIPGRIADVSVEAPSSRFKEQVRQRLNDEQWNRWSQPSLPEPAGQIAAVVERGYGRCVLTNAPLIAYGTLRQSWGEWRSFWSHDRSEVDRVHANSCLQYARAKEETRRAELTKQIGELYELRRNSVSEELSNRMYHAIYGFDQVAISDLEALIAEVQNAIRPKADLSSVDMTQLFGGSAKVRS